MPQHRWCGVAIALAAWATSAASTAGQSAHTPTNPIGVALEGEAGLADTVPLPQIQANIAEIVIDGYDGRIVRRTDLAERTSSLRYRTKTPVRIVLVNINPFRYSYSIAVGDTEVIAEASAASFLALALPGVSLPGGAGNQGQTVAQFTSLVNTESNPVLLSRITADAVNRSLLIARDSQFRLMSTVPTASTDSASVATARLAQDSVVSVLAADSAKQQLNLAKARAKAASVRRAGGAATCAANAKLVRREEDLDYDVYLAATQLQSTEESATKVAPKLNTIRRYVTDLRANANTVRLWAFVADSLLHAEIGRLTQDSVVVQPLVDQVVKTARIVAVEVEGTDGATPACKSQELDDKADALARAKDTLVVLRRASGLSALRARMIQDDRTYAGVWDNKARFWLTMTLHRYDHPIDVIVHIARKAVPQPAVTAAASDSSGQKGAGADAGSASVATTVTTTTKIPIPGIPSSQGGKSKADTTKATAGSKPSTPPATGTNGGTDGASGQSPMAAAPTSQTAMSKSGGPSAAQTPVDSTDWQVTVHYVSNSFLSVGVGLMYGALRAPQFGTIQRRIAAPPGAPADTVISSIALTDNSGFRVVPAATLSARIWQPCLPGQACLIDGVHLTVGVGIYPKSGDVTVDYLAGVGFTLFDDRLMVIPGVYIGRKNYLLPGTHIGDVASGGSAPTGSQTQAKFGIGATYRIY